MFKLKRLIGGVLLVAAIFVSSPLLAGDKTIDVNVANVPEVLVVNEAPIPVVIQNGAQTIVEWRYVGRTHALDAISVGSFRYGGFSGIAAMNKACADEYPGARAATISEGLKMDSPEAINTRMWLVPGGLVTTVVSTASGYDVVDAATGAGVGVNGASEAQARGKAYCIRYTRGSDSLAAPILLWHGAIDLSLCSNTLPVACSAPVAIPVTR